MPSHNRKTKQDAAEMGRIAKKCRTISSFFAVADIQNKSLEEQSMDSESSPSNESEAESDNNTVSSTDIASRTSTELGKKCVATKNNIHVHFRSDIGEILNAVLTPEEIEANLKAINSEEKYHLLTNHWKPQRDFVFPQTYMNRCNRSFKWSWLEKHSWLVYSRKLDGGFCLACTLFRKDSHKTTAILVTKPFIRWTKSSNILTDHGLKSSHLEAVSAAENFKQASENPNQTLPFLVHKDLMEIIEENRSIMQHVVDAILYCGRQCIALRGNNECLHSEGNPGKFLALLKLLSKDNCILESHLMQPRMKNCTYMSPDIQNELIDIIGEHVIRADITDEIHNAKFFAIMVDEVTNHNRVQMSLCVRFVDSDDNIREEFIDFISLLRQSGEFVTQDS